MTPALSLLLASATRVRMGRGGSEVFAVIGAVVVGLIVVFAIVGPKKKSMVNPQTGLDRQTLPVEENPSKRWIALGVGALCLLAALYALVSGWFATDDRGGAEGMGLLAGLGFGGALVGAYVAAYRVPACIGGAAAALLLILKPALFPATYLATWRTPPELVTLSYGAQRHLMWVMPGVILLMLAGLLYARYRRQT